ncbi:MAG: restriction endonuclease subunit S [Chitinophagaceae bacterium]|nr:restriction endonuclease subunit S [Chitinophagaceae bacterium]
MKFKKSNLANETLYLKRGISPRYVEGDGITIINQKCIRQRRIHFEFSKVCDNLKDIPEEKFLRRGDILINSTGKGTLGRSAQIKTDFEEPLLVDTHITIVRAGENMDPFYLGHLISFKEPYIEALGKGSTQQLELSRTDLGEIEIELPPLPTQHKIASILSAYDDLIENNLKRIELLEEKAFVSYMLMDKVDKYKLSDLYDTSSGGTPSRSNAEYFTGEINWFKSKELADSILLESEEKITEGAVDKSSAKLFPTGSVIMAMYGATIGKLGMLSMPSTTNQACCAIVEKDKVRSNYYILNWLLENREYVLSFRMGAAQENISQQVIKNLLVTIPKEADLKIFNFEMTPNYQLIKNIHQQNTKLREARDLLLPRLMSGEIEV